MKKRKTDTRRHAGDIERGQLENRARSQGKLLVSSTIRVARKKGSGKAEPASIPLDGQAAGALGSKPVQLGFGIEVEGKIADWKGLPGKSSQPGKRDAERDGQAFGKPHEKDGGVQVQARLAIDELSDEIVPQAQPEDEAADEQPKVEQVSEGVSDPLITTWLDTLASIAADIMRRETLSKRGEK